MPVSQTILRPRPVLLALLIYSGIAFLLFGRHGLWRSCTLGIGPDTISFVWFLNWWPFALHHGLNPFITKYVWVWHGFNMTWATAIPVLAFVMAPVTCLISPLLSFNLLTFFAPVLAAWTAFLLCRDITDDTPASLFGGYLYGFSAYETGQLLAHVNLSFTCLIPLILLLSLRRARGDLSAGTYIAGLTICLSAELGISTEILATLGVFGAAAWAIFYPFSPRDERARLRRLAAEIIAAAVLTAILAAPFLYYFVKGMGDVPHVINAAQYYATDPRNFIVPTALIRLKTPYLMSIAQQFTGNGSEQGAYLGLPLLLLLTLSFATGWRRRYMLPLLLTTLLLMLFCLGPHLQIGKTPTAIPLPWLASQYLPLIGAALPSRFSLYVSLCAALATALLLARARGALRWSGYGLALAACITLLPARSVPPWIPWPASPWSGAGSIAAKLGPNPNLLILPFGPNGPGMAWQVDAHMGFVQTGGYVGFIPRAEAADPAFAALAAGAPSAHAANALSRICATHGVNYILLAPGTDPSLRAAISSEGWHEEQADGITIVTIPPPSALDYYTITGDYWDSPQAWNWMGRRITITTRDQPLHLTLRGLWVRPNLGLRITVTIGSHAATYPIVKTSVIPLDVPPHATAVIEANQTWVPNPRTDPRKLSVIVDLDQH